MKASELIKQLEACIEANGDQEVEVRDGAGFSPVTLVDGWVDGGVTTIILEP